MVYRNCEYLKLASRYHLQISHTLEFLGGLVKSQSPGVYLASHPVGLKRSPKMLNSWAVLIALGAQDMLRTTSPNDKG